MNSPALEIILPVRRDGAELAATTASLIAQTDRRFTVLLSNLLPPDESVAPNESARKLAAAGIGVRRVRPPEELNTAEHWNWAHAQSTADWLKPLAPGERLNPGCVSALLARIAEKPHARFIRCDAELVAGWGPEVLRAPFSQAAISPAQFVNHFPRRLDWISRSVNVAYHRAAWRAAGGLSPQFKAFAALNLNVILALHHGIENIGGPLAAADYTDDEPLNGAGGGRVNHCLELWLLLRQARNYCQSAKIPWPRGWLPARTLFAILGRM